MSTRQIQVTLPESAAHLVMSTRALLNEFQVSQFEYRGCDYSGSTAVMFVFTLLTSESGVVLERLTSLGVATLDEVGKVEVLELKTSSASLPPDREVRIKKKYRVADRTSIAEIYQNVDSNFHLTFDYLLSIAVASIICGVGLVSEQPTFVTASMLLSPLMGPIMACTLGACVGDYPMLWKGFRNEVYGVLLSLVIGMGVGAAWPEKPAGTPSHDPALDVLHYQPSDLAIGAVIALPSGAALALAVTAVMSTTIVGVAIATSLLPPVISCGINGSRALSYLSRSMHAEMHARLVDSGLAFAMLIINWLLIFVGAGLTLRLKQVTPALMRGGRGRGEGGAHPELREALVPPGDALLEAMESERRELEQMRDSATRRGQLLLSATQDSHHADAQPNGSGGSAPTPSRQSSAPRLSRQDSAALTPGRSPRADWSRRTGGSHHSATGTEGGSVRGSTIGEPNAALAGV